MKIKEIKDKVILYYKQLDHKKEILASGIACFVISSSAIKHLIWPIMYGLPLVREKILRYYRSEQTFFWILFILLWLFCIQWIYKRLFYVYLYAVYSIYALVLLITLFGKVDQYQDSNFNPFNFLRLIDFNSPWKMANPILNFISFIPLGVLYGFNLNFRRFCLISLGTIFMIETIQYTYQIGAFELSDILLNFLGCLVGYKFWQKYGERFRLV